MKIKNQITMELKMESFQKLNSVMSIQHHLIEQKRVLIPIACTMEAIDINNNSKLPKVWILESLKLFCKKSKIFEFGNIFETISWEPPTHCVGGDIVKNVSLFSDWLSNSLHLIGYKRHLLVKTSMWKDYVFGWISHTYVQPTLFHYPHNQNDTCSFYLNI